MGFYATTEDPNVMMKGNHNTQSCDYIFICQDGLYIASTTPEEIFKLLIKKENLNLISSKDSYQQFNHLSRKNWINYIMRCNAWTTKSDFIYI